MPNRLYVSNLPSTFTDSDLEHVFAQAGTVKNATIVINRYSGRSAGVGFVEMANSEGRAAALTQLNGCKLMGKNIRVSVPGLRNVRLEANDRSGGYDHISRRH